MISKPGKRLLIAAAIALLAGCAGPTTSSFVPNSNGAATALGDRASIERHAATPEPTPSPTLPPLSSGVIGRPGLPGVHDVIGRPGLPASQPF